MYSFLCHSVHCSTMLRRLNYVVKTFPYLAETRLFLPQLLINCVGDALNDDCGQDLAWE